MAEDKWKEGIQKNWSDIVKNLGNPDELVEYLHHNITPPLLNEDQARNIKEKTGTRREKTRLLMKTLMYGDERVLRELHSALQATGNKPLADLLAPYVKEQKQKRRKTLHLPPHEWPPSTKELKEMHDAEAEQCDIDDLMKSQSTNQKEIYRMTAKRRGLAIIINNADFGKRALKRVGSDLDRDKLSRVLSQLHFSVKIYNNMTGADMLKIAEESSNWDYHGASDCFVFAVLSHGSSRGINGTDGSVICVDDIVKNFNKINCPKLTGKPKVFLFQSCRSPNSPRTEDSQSGESQADSMETNPVSNAEDHEDDNDIHKAFQNLPQNSDQVQCDSGMEEGPTKQIQKVTHPSSDFFFAYATPEGFKAYRSEQRGSWFIQAIVWVLKYNASKEHLEELMTRVNRYVSTAVMEEGNQVSEVRSTLQKCLYFYPGVFNDPPEKNDFFEKPVTVV
ncbi:caspase-3-like [Ylistrum balloti]|uniref:caspase-3-like n=1 Tax=Ylistrum balloti TaxID=509963 RepID=UPI0029059C59|nr:caspase-3-like [Ylistrum balloti]